MTNVSITTVHHELHSIVSKQILKSMIGSINATSIAYARGHLRFNALENIAARKGSDVPTIDDYNDAQNAIDEAEFREKVVAPDMGAEIIMSSGELAEKLMRIRGYFAGMLDLMKAQATDAPLTIAETVKFQMSRQPDSNETLIEALAAAVEIDADMLKAAQLKMITDDAADLKANAGKVVTFLEQFEQGTIDELGVESIFDSLPAHVQYKLMSAAIRAHDKAQQKALVALLRGKIDAAGDIKLIKGHREDLLVWLVTFSKAKRVQLDAYLERGGTLMEIEDRSVLVGQDQKPNAASMPKSQMAPIGSCDVTQQLQHIAATADLAKLDTLLKAEPKVTGAARRAPAPKATEKA